MVQYMYDLLSGKVLPATPPDQLTMGCEIQISYRLWGGLRAKKMSIVPIDASGELLRVVMSYVPNAQTIDELVMKVRERARIPVDDIDIINVRDYILSADGYVIVVDSTIGRDDERRREQFLGLVHFMQNLRIFRDNARLPMVRGVAILLTKVDRLTRKPETESDVEEYIQDNYPVLITELNGIRRRGGRVGYFYSYLEVRSGSLGSSVAMGGNLPIYSYKEYERLLYWFRDTF